MVDGKTRETKFEMGKEMTIEEDKEELVGMKE